MGFVHSYRSLFPLKHHRKNLTQACFFICMRVHNVIAPAYKSASKYALIARLPHLVCALWRICQDLLRYRPAVVCGESWHWDAGRSGGIDPLCCLLQCWPAVFPMHPPEQWVEPMVVWLVWLGGKWKPLSRVSFCCILMQSAGEEAIWIAKTAPAMLIWHWTVSIGGCLSTCWLCFVFSHVLKWASLSAATL